jgi:PAS domain S-box-containing protein
MMNYQDKTKPELIKELQKMQKEYDSLKTSYEKDITKLKRSEEEIKKGEFLGKVLLDNLPLVTLVLKKHTREIVACNKLAVESGAVIGKKCYETIAHCNHICPFCKSPDLWETGKEQQVEAEYIGRYWEGRWVPFSDDLYVHYIIDITERKEAEASLKLALEWQEAIFEGSRDTIFISDQDSRFVAVNNAACDLTGYSREQLMKMRIPEIHDLPDLDAYKMYHQRIFDGEEILTEAKILRSDGTKIDTEFNNRCVSIAGRLYMHTTARNITERKLLGEMMKESEKKYRMIFNEVPIGIAISTIEGKIIDINKAQAEMIGRTAKELNGRSVNEYYIYPDRRLEMIELFNKTGKVSDFEMGLKKKDGSIIVELMNIDQIKIENKDYLFTTGRDITRQKKVEEALQLERENFRHSLDDSPLGVRIATKEGKTIYGNQTILNFYGYNSLRELQNTLLKKRYTPESFAEAQNRKKQREHGDLSATSYEINIVRKNGEIRHLRVFRKKVLWDGMLQYQIIYEDITGHKQAEEEIRKSKKLLEDLYRHQIDIRENERASISREIHDELGQSMTALKLDLNQMHKYVCANPEAIMKLDSMIELVSNTIKDVQRISSDLRPGILDDLGLISAIEWYCDEFEKRTGIKCSLKMDDSDYNDSQINLTLFRALQETLTNVIRHARASSVTVKLHKSDKGTSLTIRDNGIGISEEKIESHKSLGLISMRERAKQFNGKINISSKKGSGTKFTIYIPDK